MPPKTACQHTKLHLTTSPHAAEAGYTHPTRSALSKAATTARKITSHNLPPTTFPAPLVLPDDDLSIDPKYPPQSLLSWKRLKARNAITSLRNKIYYLNLPVRSSDSPEFQSWATPIDPETKSQIRGPPSPLWEDVVDYLSAFFHPLELVEYPSITTISKWSSKSQHLVLSTSSSRSGVQLRTRPSPDGPESSCYTHQLSLLDILDFAIEILPEDAYAIIVFTHHDLYESDEDDFCIGRAFGGSRVCVVSSARYHPFSEELAGVGNEEFGGKRHDWPGSHCADFVQKMCQESEEPSRKTKKVKTTSTPEAEGTKINQSFEKTPMYRAIAAHRSENPDGLKHREYLRAIWLSRLCKTASHELLHCFGLDHCVYYACMMQGTTSILEDTRQPFYLCPIDHAKLKEALSGKDENIGKLSKDEWELEWCGRMKAFCSEIVTRDISMGWRPIIAWLEGRIEELGGRDGLDGVDGIEGTKEDPIELE
ncbi:hypothetical protein TWF788_002978 [Orbilia oligospora]|uniref:Archaemetzincin-2 n=1 Tax=Orbilia oligospora TaxID=2813651 RepID=A0A7C8Q0Q7_ORBOL|nr:hypothetical protein TWF788_002978 [Orbilia oligospora]